MKTSQNGDVVIAHYVGTLDDGTVFDKTQEQDPVSFIVGADTILPDINRAFIGMSEGDEKQITIAPQDAFGMWEETNVKKLSRLYIDEMEPQIGQVLKLTMEEGTPDQFGKITGFDDLTIHVDLNHPLAGQTLHYSIKVVKIIKKDDPAE